MAAEFWNKTVMDLRTVRELAIRHRTEGQHVRSKDRSRYRRCFFCFFQNRKSASSVQSVGKTSCFALDLCQESVIFGVFWKIFVKIFGGFG